MCTRAAACVHPWQQHKKKSKYWNSTEKMNAKLGLISLFLLEVYVFAVSPHRISIGNFRARLRKMVWPHIQIIYSIIDYIHSQINRNGNWGEKQKPKWKISIVSPTKSKRRSNNQIKYGKWELWEQKKINQPLNGARIMLTLDSIY